jgi:hypothetical protein
MIEIKNLKVYGLEHSIIRSGYPMRFSTPDINESFTENDLSRSKKLGSAISGTGHDNFLKGIIVQFDLRYPQYFTPQLQRYHWIDIVSSQSKMHTLTKREDIKNDCGSLVEYSIIEQINKMIFNYNNSEDKDYWFRKIINNLPMGFMLWMGISTNYLQLKTIYKQRKNHKLSEWKDFCRKLEELPLFLELIRKN